MERTHNESRHGTYGWIALAGIVALADVYLEETLSHAFGRGLDHPKYRPYVLGALAVTNLHLLRVLPEPVDPFPYIISAAKKVLH